MRIWILIFVDADPDLTSHPDSDPNPDPSFQLKDQTIEKVLNQAHIPFILACHLKIDADPDPVPDLGNNLVADPNAGPDPDFILLLMRIRMRIQVTKMMRIRIHNTGFTVVIP
jgi:hypothetical protein